MASLDVTELRLLGYTNIVLGVDSALSYHGFGTQSFFERPLLVTDKLPVGCVIRGEPWYFGVREVSNTEPTRYEGVRVTNIIDSILDTIDVNQDSESIILALDGVSSDIVLCNKLREKARARGILELLEKEFAEVEGYFSY